MQEFLQKLQQERLKFIKIVNEIYSGNTNTMEDLDHKVFNEHNRKLFLWNAQAMKEKRRYSGKPYYIHPASASFLLSMLVNKDDKDRDKAIGYILTHDIIDEALNYNLESYQKIKKLLSQEFGDELNAAILLSYSSRYDVGYNRFSMKVAGVMQVKEYGNRAHALALIADKLDNQLDIEFLDVSEEYSRMKSISKWFIAYPLFAVEELSDKIPQSLIDSVRKISEETRIANNISEDMVNEYLEAYNEVKSTNQDIIKAKIKEHLSKFGFEQRY